MKKQTEKQLAKIYRQGMEEILFSHMKKKLTEIKKTKK